MPSLLDEMCEKAEKFRESSASYVQGLIAQARAEGRREGLKEAATALDAADTPLQPVYSVAARIVRALLDGGPDVR